MRQKVDIAEVERATKIRAKYLRALENEEFGLLPGSTFVKTFLRTYAEHLGLDAQLLVEEYRAQHEPRGEGEMAPLAPQPRRQRDRERRPRGGGGGSPGVGTALIVVVAVILVIFAILGLTGGDTSNNSGGKTTATKPARKPKPHRKRTAAAPGAVALKVVPAEPTYVCVDSGHGTPVTFEGVLANPRTFKGKHVRINSGRSSVTLIANGKRVTVPKSANPVGYDFTPKSTKPLPSGQRPCA
ncbi:MAG: cytoskeleton protein RodZ [Thermoleophilaceae bacterium]|jgi:cytoskeleton protein RodZ|nr:cytoskeleton protein RodZ [Thermoleophilaceae bacterium]